MSEPRAFLLPNNIPLAIMDNAVMHVYVQESVGTYVFASLGWVTKNRVSGSCGNSVFHLLSDCRTVLKQLNYFTFPLAM